MPRIFAAAAAANRRRRAAGARPVRARPPGKAREWPCIKRPHGPHSRLNEFHKPGRQTAKLSRVCLNPKPAPQGGRRWPRTPLAQRCSPARDSRHPRGGQVPSAFRAKTRASAHGRPAARSRPRVGLPVTPHTTIGRVGRGAGAQGEQKSRALGGGAGRSQKIGGALQSGMVESFVIQEQGARKPGSVEPESPHFDLEYQPLHEGICGVD